MELLPATHVNPLGKRLEPTDIQVHRHGTWRKNSGCNVILGNFAQSVVFMLCFLSFQSFFPSPTFHACTLLARCNSLHHPLAQGFCGRCVVVVSWSHDASMGRTVYLPTTIKIHEIHVGKFIPHTVPWMGHREWEHSSPVVEFLHSFWRLENGWVGSGSDHSAGRWELGLFSYTKS